MKLCAWTLCALLWAAAARPARGQWQNGGSLAGQILDGDGAPVEHARLEIEEMGSGTTYELNTDAQGRFLLPRVAPGSYSVDVEAAGFAPWREGDVEVGAGAQVDVAPRLDRLLATGGHGSGSAGVSTGAGRVAGDGASGALKREQQRLVRLKKPHAAGLRVGNPETGGTEIAEARRPSEPAANWEVFEPEGGATHGENRGAKAGAALHPLPEDRDSMNSVAVRSGQIAGRPAAAAEIATQGAGGAEVAEVVVPQPEKVHARVTVRTAQGTVSAEIAEVPIHAAQEAGWSSFEPGNGRGGAGGVAAGKPVSESAGEQLAKTERPALEQRKPFATSAARAERVTVHPASGSAAQNARSSASGELPAVGSVYAPEANAAAQPVETAKERRARAAQAKLQELAETFVPARANVTATDTHRETGRDDVAAQAESAAQALNEFEPESDEGEIANTQVGQNFSGDAGTDALVAPERQSKDGRLHGQVFAEDRDKAWGSQNGFTTLTTQQADGSFVTAPYDPPDRRVQVGLEMGGGIAQGRGNWFLAVDGLTRNFPGMAVPSNPEKFFANLTSSQLQTLAGRLTAGGAAVRDGEAEQDYTQAMGDLTALLGPVGRTEQQVIAFPRFDWKVNERNRIRVGYDFVRLDAKNGMRTEPTATWGIGSFGTRRLDLDAISASWNKFVTANVLNQLRYTHAHDLESEMADSPTAFEEQFAKNSFGAPPEVGVASGSGGFRFGTPSTLNRPAYPDELRQEAADTLTWMRGRNQVDVGYALDYVRDHTSGLTYATGDYTYSTKEAFVADMLSPDHCDASSTGAGDYPCWSTFRQTTGPTDFTFDTADYAGFATDTLKLRPRLTLSVGARYDYEKLPKPNAGLVNPDIPETAVLPSEGNVSPRAGFAWELPWSSDRRGVTTVLRGGFGIFYGRIPNTSVLAALTQTGAPNAQRIYLFKPLDVGAPTFPYVFSSHPDLQVEPDATYFATGFEHPRAEQAQVTLEQSLGRRLVLTASYWGSFGSQLPRIVDQNIDLTNVGQIAYTVTDPDHLGPLPVTYTSKFYYRRLNPKYQQMAAMESTANARYQAVGFSLVGRLPHAMAVTLGYRYAHDVDDNPYGRAYDGRWDVLDPANLSLEHGTSNLDIRDRLRGGLVLHEPWRAEGWLGNLVDGYTMDMTGGVQSGKPYTMRISSTVPTMSCSYEEWLQAGNNCVQIPLSGVITGAGGVPVSALGGGLNGSGGGRWLPQVGRNTFRYPGTYTANLRMGKKFRFGGGSSLVFEADVSNLMNHRNVTNIETMGYTIAGVKTSTLTGDLKYLDGTSGHAAFGTVTNANSTRVYTDRQVELIMRWIF